MIAVFPSPRPCGEKVATHQRCAPDEGQIKEAAVALAPPVRSSCIACRKLIRELQIDKRHDSIRYLPVPFASDVRDGLLERGRCAINPRAVPGRPTGRCLPPAGAPRSGPGLRPRRDGAWQRYRHSCAATTIDPADASRNWSARQGTLASRVRHPRTPGAVPLVARHRAGVPHQPASTRSLANLRPAPYVSAADGCESGFAAFGQPVRPPQQWDPEGPMAGYLRPIRLTLRRLSETADAL